jgi:hypothetical protein
MKLGSLNKRVVSVFIYNFCHHVQFSEGGRIFLRLKEGFRADPGCKMCGRKLMGVKKKYSQHKVIYITL